MLRPCSRWLVVLEDLHDADKGTLDMLTHVTRHLAGARLLILGTYRDVEVDRNHPLSATLAELRRVVHIGRVLLRGLNADEVRRMLESITRESVPWGLAEAVHRQTEGNPLFVQEVVRYLVEQRLLARAGGRGHSGTSLEMNIPEGLRDVIGKRLIYAHPRVQPSALGRGRYREGVRPWTSESRHGDRARMPFTRARGSKRVAVVEERSGVGLAVPTALPTPSSVRRSTRRRSPPRRLRLHQQVARALER